MANNKMVNGMDTQTRIQNVWDDVVSGNKYPTVTDFAKMCEISYSTLCHRYTEWAEKVRGRRDQKHGKRKRSIASASKEIVKSWDEAIAQMMAMQKEIQTLRKQQRTADEKCALLNETKNQCVALKKQNQNLLGAFDYLIDQLKIAGVKEEKVMKIWKMVESHIQPVKKGT